MCRVQKTASKPYLAPQKEVVNQTDYHNRYQAAPADSMVDKTWYNPHRPHSMIPHQHQTNEWQSLPSHNYFNQGSDTQRELHRAMVKRREGGIW